MSKKYRFNTECVHAGKPEPQNYGPLHPPIAMTSNYLLPTDGSKIDYDKNAPGVYSRHGNENETILENKLSRLEGAEDCAVYASGVAALNAVFMTQLSSGDHVVCSQVCYAAVRKLFTWVLPKQFRVEVTFVDSTDLEAVKSAVKENTKIIHIETPGNPTCLVSDIRAIAEIARKCGALLTVDNTFATPYCQKPLELGADLSISSLTKYCNGHGDVLGGCVLGSRELLYDIKQQATIVNGGILNPFASWLISRGLTTLPLRMRQHNENAMHVAEYLENRPEVRFVLYPGLKSHPNHELACNQMRNGFSGMMTFGLKASEEKSLEFLSNLELIKHAVSLGDADTITQWMSPDDPVMVNFPEIMRAGFFRLSVGLEDIEDILEDLEKAFEKTFGAQNQ